MNVAIIVLIIVIVLVAVLIAIFNGIITKRNRCDNAWQNIDTQLQRRNDLIPNVVESVKGYMAHEANTLQALTVARTAISAAASIEEKMEASNQMSQALSHLFAVAESYPDLKANTNFLDLQQQLQDSENKISYARQSFNDCVLMYNNAIQTFPGSLVASIGGFAPRQGFEADVLSREVPEVRF